MSTRLRLFAIVLAAALASMAPLAIVLLVQLRDAFYARHLAEARQRLAVARAAADACAGEECVDRVGRAASARVVPGPCAPAPRYDGPILTLCTPLASGGALELREDTTAVRAQLSELDAQILKTLAIFLFVLVGAAALLLERGVVRRLSRIDDSLEAIGEDQSVSELVPEGGDSVGRLGAAVNRLARRVREERERTRAQIEQLRAAREEVTRASRLASVGRLAAGVAHEVGNPVAALLGYAALMRDRAPAGSDLAGYAERIEREAARIDRILRDLLDLSRPPAHTLPIQLARVVERAIASVAPQHPEVSFLADLAQDFPRVRGEEHYVGQVFVNLLANAARAGAKNVSIRGRAAAPDAVQVEVEDDGTGIPEAALQRLFEPFFTTAAPGQGTGLGLALCHATMERIGGSIVACNRAGRPGARFELRFAISESGPASSFRG